MSPENKTSGSAIGQGFQFVVGMIWAIIVIFWVLPRIVVILYDFGVSSTEYPTRYQAPMTAPYWAPRAAPTQHWSDPNADNVPPGFHVTRQ